MVFITHTDDNRMEFSSVLKAFGLAKKFSIDHSLSYTRGLSFVHVPDMHTRKHIVAQKSSEDVFMKSTFEIYV